MYHQSKYTKLRVESFKILNKVRLKILSIKDKAFTVSY